MGAEPHTAHLQKVDLFSPTPGHSEIILAPLSDWRLQVPAWRRPVPFDLFHNLFPERGLSVAFFLARHLIQSLHEVSVWYGIGRGHCSGPKGGPLSR